MFSVGNGHRLFQMATTVYEREIIGGEHSSQLGSPFRLLKENVGARRPYKPGSGCQCKLSR